ncbi:phage antirepressor KilAC domain-containing protein [Microbacterium trichothecenolyticum]|uniref:phage antirepressor KilAC domain-containing protein n=1 Tax=Microbacterium trichothecenolyticum TaxID=69370 RepID=UPI001CB79377|nr:phage antirepressor KilAC domain-containing protein [Microbacterium trichothecenolyticum]
MAELAQTRKLIPRWIGHGDLTIVVEGARVYGRADQVEQLAGIAPWSGGETLLGDTWAREIDGHVFYELDDAIARCEAAGTSRAGEFLTWIRETLEQLLTDEVLDLAQRSPAFIGSYPIRIAAARLSEDPAVHIGQQGLFAHLERIGWIERAGTDWTMTATSRRNGWLTIREVTIPAANRTHRRTYPQLHVTPTGLTELAATLHALHPEQGPERPPHPQLFD